ncbi:MAG: alpha/beta hydrolase [Candidatus Omnitrophica bacterium]|nr:alpha/beta hydrolase [Candidatus Omnitrophota bacterium]
MNDSEIPEGVKFEKNIVFKKTDEKDLILDLYTHPGSDEKAPLLVFIHGGAWRGGKPADYHYYCVKFAKLGYAVATVSYRFSQEAKFPAALEDVTDSVRWLREHAEEYNYDPNRIALIGGSAGGHLSMLVGYTWDEMTEDGKNPIKVVVDIYGPADLTTDFAIGNKVVINFIGDTYENAKQKYEDASPIFQLDKKDPPTLIIHGTIDETVPIVQSDMLEEKLNELGIPNHYEKFPGWPHTMDLAEPVNARVRFLIERFLEEYL